MTNVSNVHKVYCIKDTIQLREKKRFDYNTIISLLLEGEELFLEINRRQAYYLRKQLEKRLDMMIETYPAYMDGMAGYMVRSSPIKDYLRKRILESQNGEKGNKEEDRRD